MAAVFHTPIAVGAAGNASTVDTPLLQIDTAMQVAHNADGTLKTNSVAAAQITDASVGVNELAAAVAGAGLAGGAGSALAVQVDASTVEINANALRLKDAGITGAKLNAQALDTINIVWAPDNLGPSPTTHYNGRNRWYVSTGRPEQALTLDRADVANPYGTWTLRFLGTAGTISAGKVIYLDEIGPTGGALSLLFAVEWRAAAGTYQIKAQMIDASETAYGSVATSGVVTGDGTPQTTVLPALALTSGPYGVRIWAQRVSGSSDFNLYHLWGAKGQYIGATPTRRVSTTVDGLSGRPGIVWDPTFNASLPGTQTADFGGRLRWGHPELMTVIRNNANSPWGGTSLRCTTAGVTAQAGKRIYLDEAGLAVGDTVGFACLVTADSPNFRLRASFIDATNAVLSTVDGIFVSSSGALQMGYTPNAAIPASTTSIAVFLELGYSGVARNTELHALWGGKDGIVDAWPMACRIPGQAIEVQAALTKLGSERLRSFRHGVAQIATGTTKQVDVLVLGDSWIEHSYLTTPLRAQLQAWYGNAGGGYVDFSGTFGTGHSTAYWELVNTSGAATARTGTWTDTLRDAGTGRGLTLLDMRTTDLAATAKLTTTVAHTGLRIYSYKVSGGGTFQYRIDGGGWTSVNTDNLTAGVITTTLTGLANTTHLVEFQITVAGAAGVTLLGMDLRGTANGLRLHRAGVNGSDALNWTGVDATTWQNALAALGNVDLAVICLGTNDRARTAFPSTFGSGLQTMIDRIRTVYPYADVLLLCPAEAATGVLPFGGYEAAMRGIAAQNKHAAFVSGSAAFGAYAESSAMTPSMWVDTAHATADGFRLLADLTASMLKVP